MDEQRYGASTASGEYWPPRAECVLRAPEGGTAPEALVVSHPVTAWTRSAIVLGIPVVWVICTGVAVRTLGGLRTRTSDPSAE